MIEWERNEEKKRGKLRKSIIRRKRIGGGIEKKEIEDMRVMREGLWEIGSDFKSILIGGIESSKK